MAKKNNQWWASSTGSGVSLTLKGVIVGLVPLFVAISRQYGVEVSESEVLELIEAVFGALSLTLVVVGLIRKLAVKFNR